MKWHLYLYLAFFLSVEGHIYKIILEVYFPLTVSHTSLSITKTKVLIPVNSVYLFSLNCCFLLFRGLLELFSYRCHGRNKQDQDRLSRQPF
jgi:hypothetical protein